MPIQFHGKDKSTCKLSDDGADAANFLLTQGLQQVNVVASSGAKTNATEQLTDTHGQARGVGSGQP